jgi:hypothetical protein
MADDGTGRRDNRSDDDPRAVREPCRTASAAATAPARSGRIRPRYGAFVRRLRRFLRPDATAQRRLLGLRVR